jgi:nitrite reductase/ring-hydroxylating ferredoxin subunit
MSNISAITDYLEHKASEVICIQCRCRWIAVRPKETLLKQLECPNHHIGYAIETGEYIATGAIKNVQRD